jgi:hypothetical protein
MRDEEKNYPDLKTFLQLKAQRGKAKDLADIVEVLKTKSLTKDELQEILNKMDEKQRRNFKRALESLREEDSRYR